MEKDTKLDEQRAAYSAVCDEWEEAAGKLADAESLSDEDFAALEKQAADLKSRAGRLSSVIQNREDVLKARGSMRAAISIPPVAGQPSAISATSTSISDVVLGKESAEKDPKCGFPDMGAFASSVYAAADPRNPVIDPRLLATGPTTFGNEAVGGDGGFAVPPDFREPIIQEVAGEENLFTGTDNFASSSNSITFPYDETTPWGGTGITANWTAEGAQISQSKPVLTQRTLRAEKLAVLVPMTDELLEDSPAMGQYLTSRSPEIIIDKLNTAFYVGTGTGQPLGFLTHAATVSVAKESSQVADTILAANIYKMHARLFSKYASGAEWLINQDCLPQLNQMFVPIKNVAGSENVGGFPIYVPGNTMSVTPYGTLLGLPVRAIQTAKTVGDLGDITLINRKGYSSISKGTIRQSMSPHLWFDYDVQAFKFIIRIGGRPWLDTAITPKNGSNTLSYAVVLAARA